MMVQCPNWFKLQCVKPTFWLLTYNENYQHEPKQLAEYPD